eukprot:gnl/TRDRNA2_/TRDRNA2_39064_c0_seq1.p1 gnl/TRDRNA2_/TRDRNA2_39064_c0~~gnl/TRDRNA2_/TRDRNA2_39064_c0_seq1.p1  ORF type:complete len:292 (-),score=70.80 gnl/TRDRNA2_/TRDRNA2_39064_c0_seq1:125-1000(-)
MGAGASSGVSAAVSKASGEDLKVALAELSSESKQKLQAALDTKGNVDTKKLSWIEEFIICGAYSCKDIPTATKAVLVDAAIQVKEEPRAPRFAVYGTATSTGGEPPAETKDKIYWLAEFESEDAWAGPEHRGRESNKEFMKELMSTGLSGDTPADMMQDMAGSYTGPCWHLEKPGSGSGDVFAILVRGKAKDADAAQQLVELNKAHALTQLETEEGALRYTIMRMANMAGPLAKDEVTVQWIEVWKSAEDFAKHKTMPHMTENVPKMKALLGSETPDMVVVEFPETKHFAK